LPLQLPDHRNSGRGNFLQRFSLLVLFTGLLLFTSKGQEHIIFYTSDSLKVEGDIYLKQPQLPFIILCHHKGSVSDEYTEIARRLLNLNYNCLVAEIGNTRYATRDILAAIVYIQQVNSQPVILLGSTCSASLCLLAAVGNPMVKAVVALSPGEYYQPFIRLSDEAGKISQHVFASAARSEYPYLKEMLSKIPEQQLTLFKPENGEGNRGSDAFRSENETSGEYWFALMIFFKKLQQNN
jgi:hypothetical protein